MVTTITFKSHKAPQDLKLVRFEMPERGLMEKQ